MPLGADRSPWGAPSKRRRTPRLRFTARAIALAAAAVCAPLLTSCASRNALIPPPSPGASHSGDVRIVSLASYSLGGSPPDPARSRAIAESVVRHGTRGLEQRGYAVVGDASDAIAGYADPELRFDMVLEPAPGEYAQRVLAVRSPYVAGDAELARIERKRALGEWIRHLRTPHGVGLVDDDSLRLAFRAGPAGQAGHILVVETLAHAVRTSTRVAEGLATGIVTLGWAPWWERPVTSISIYLVDTATAEVVWYDEISGKVEGTPDRVGKLVAEMLNRMK